MSMIGDSAVKAAMQRLIELDQEIKDGGANDTERLKELLNTINRFKSNAESGWGWQ